MGPPNPRFLTVQSVLQSCRNPSCEHCSCERRGGGLRPPQPPASFKPRKACFKVVETHHVSVALSNEGSCAPPPNPPASFKPCKVCFNSNECCWRHRVSVSIVVANRASFLMNLVETHRLSVGCKWGGCLLPTQPLPLSRAKPASKPMHLVETHHVKWGGCAPPLPTPRFFFLRAKCASKHMNVDETHRVSIDFSCEKRGGCAPPTPPH